MRCVVQRVAEASVTVGDNLVSKVGHGMSVLVGISTSSQRSQIAWMAKKLLSLRIFDDENGKPWAKNVTEVNGSLLLVSQFTLCHVLKGAKPDFHNALTAAESGPFFDDFVAAVQAQYKEEMVKTGTFGAHMKVNIVNDGPVTLVVDAPESPPKEKGAAQPKKEKKKQEGGDGQKKKKEEKKEKEGETEAKTEEKKESTETKPTEEKTTEHKDPVTEETK